MTPLSRAGTLAGLTVLGLLAGVTPALAGAEVEVTVTGVVRDDSGQGWPLWADVAVTGEDGRPLATTTSDPWTGRYRVTVPADEAATVRATARYAGYRETTAPVTGRVSDVAVPVDTDTCVALGYRHVSAGLLESFDGVPAEWTVTDAIGAGQGWRFDDPDGHGNRTGGTGGFAIVDSAYYGYINRQDTALVSPPVDLTDVPDPSIGFASDFPMFDYGPGRSGIGEVDLSLDDGATWRNVWRVDDNAPGPERVVVPVPDAAGEPDVRVRFRYSEGDLTAGRWWQVDDVFVGDRSCDPLPGGLVAGVVSDRNTGTPLTGATVRGGDTATTTVDDGFYWTFSPATGGRSFTASSLLYRTGTEPVRVAPNQVNRLDFALAAGRIEAAVDEATTDVALGGRGNTRLRLANTGTAPATVTVVERPGEFTLQDISSPVRTASAAGAEPRLVHGDFTPGRLDPGTSSPAPAATRAGTEWVPQGDLPIPVVDNAAAAHDGIVYSLGGRSGIRQAIQDVYAYDAGVWTRLADLPHGREKPAAGFVDGRLYVVGGWGTGIPTDLVEQLDIYDPATGTWSAGAPMPDPVAGAGTAVLDGALYVIGGCPADADCGTTAVHRYDAASNTWDRVADYPEPVAWSSCGGLEAAVYCAGGIGNDTSSRAGYAYDPGLDRWTPRADLPIDLWGAATTVANGRLLVSGGVTDGRATITNQGFAYDPAADTWSALPNANSSVYRGAGACGFLKFGGRQGGGSPTPFVELLPGHTACGPDRDADWLAVSPRSVTLAPGERVTLTVRFDARRADQPGEFAADLLVRTDTPYRTSEVPAAMTVAAPRGWGLLTGAVTGLTCAGVTSPVRGATVTLTDRTGSRALGTGPDGEFARWLPARRYSLIASADGYLPAVAESRVRRGQETTVDLTLDRLDCA
ncbi:carboxypeptidase regulatory-like domain-containing protein [Actinophytocola gossypii]|uniref:Carboxypeptidase regulatory-like domain-containing protein n=1 Tax=Actinophytocola gossypii TaxID=2812003 RepID=A0ABT2JCQ0_9PSEU|nr:carboxypeptidase regulatory-like domain-containing protein [Actinophytocola gossypii]MCT2585528.1 carboxypeptidase regulatory-like domain-containing protein [Actinophytocola gossypii]